MSFYTPRVLESTSISRQQEYESMSATLRHLELLAYRLNYQMAFELLLSPHFMPFEHHAADENGDERLVRIVPAEALADINRAFKVGSCKPWKRCQQIRHCSWCYQFEAKEKSRRIRQRLHAVLAGTDHDAKLTDIFSLFFLTLTLPDCKPSELREQYWRLVDGFRALMKDHAFRFCKGWMFSIELKPAADPTLCNLHMHVALARLGEHGGPAWFSHKSQQKRINDCWRNASPYARSADLKPIHDLDGVGRYFAKHTTTRLVPDLIRDLKDPARALEERRQLAGLDRYEFRGVFADPAMPAWLTSEGFWRCVNEDLWVKEESDWTDSEDGMFKLIITGPRALAMVTDRVGWKRYLRKDPKLQRVTFERIKPVQA